MGKEKTTLSFDKNTSEKLKTRRYVELKDDMTKASESEFDFSRIALSLANDYESVYYIDMQDDSYIEYKTSGADKKLHVASRGDDFFADTVINCEKHVFKEDQKEFLLKISKLNFDDAIKHNITFTHRYRLVIDGVPRYYQLKTTRGTGIDDRYIIVGVKNIDALVKREQKSAKEAETFSQIAHALAIRYEVIYYVDLITGEYTEYSSSDKYAQLKVGAKGYDFFGDTKYNMKKSIYSEDYPMMAEVMDKVNFINSLSNTNVYTITYRLLLDGEPEYVNLRAVRPLGDENHVVIGVVNINDSMKRKFELKNAISLANKDALTGIKNKRAYDYDSEKLKERMLSSVVVPEFAVVVCDINDLKVVNDTKGHHAGDEFIKDACKIICDTYKHSPVYRVGGDEFALILTGEDYMYRNALLETIRSISKNNKKNGLVTLACGMGVYSCELDKDVKTVFERADNAMYENKRRFKADID